MPQAAYPNLKQADNPRFCLALLPVGFAGPTGHPVAGELLPHLFTLTTQPVVKPARSAVYFLLHFP